MNETTTKGRKMENFVTVEWIREGEWKELEDKSGE